MNAQLPLPGLPAGHHGAYCPRCDRWREAARFGRSAARPCGLQGYCRDCRNAYGREKYALRQSGLVKRYGTPVPDGYVERRAGRSEQASAVDFGVSQWVIRRWDRETGFVSTWALRRRLHRPQVAMPDPVVPRALSSRPSALAEGGIDPQLLRNTMAAFGGRTQAVTP